MVHADRVGPDDGAVLVHIYLGTIGMKGAYQGMRTGYVDEGWAQEHHALWYDDIKAGKIPAQRSAAAAGAAGGQRIGPQEGRGT